MYLLPDWIQAFGRRYPNLTVSLNSSVTSDIVAQVLRHKLDVGIVEGEIEQHPANLGILELRKMHLYVIVGQGHRWWNRETVAIEDLAGQPFISRQQNSQTRIWMDRVLSEHGVTPRIVAELDNPESIKQAVLSGMGISILPKCAVYNQEAMNLLRALPLQNVPLHRTMKLLWDRSTPFSPITRAFLSNLTGEFPQLDRILSIS